MACRSKTRGSGKRNSWNMSYYDILYTFLTEVEKEGMGKNDNREQVREKREKAGNWLKVKS